MNKIFIGIDNGVTATVGAISTSGKTIFEKVPTKSEQSYTKKPQNITRIRDFDFRQMLSKIINDLRETTSDPIYVYLERPMINNLRFAASISAARSLESVVNSIESFNLPLEYLDSKLWQRLLLPNGIEGSAALKKASMDIGCRLFPQHKELIIKHKDADGLLIAEFARRKFG